MNKLDRKTIRCLPCNLRQFINKGRTCVKCHKPFEVKPEAPKPPIPVKPAVLDFAFWMSFAFWHIRTSSGIYQRSLAVKINRPRTWVGKIENDQSRPAMASMKRLCKGLDVTPWYVIRMTEYLVFGE